MCGIFGIWNRDGAPVDVRALGRATTSLRHRGPDDEGYLLVDTRSGRTVLCGGDDTMPALGLPRLDTFAGDRFDLAFGFRRLSILDLSPAGHQPMSGADRRHWIVFNGEIYNYLDLRRELESLGHGFRTGTDTEVVLAAYAQWGASCLNRLRGMFAFAIWDSARSRIWLARDRFGIKPLYWTREAGTVRFASELKALLASGVPFSPSAPAIASYLQAGTMPSAREGKTFCDGIESIPAAHNAAISSEDIDVRRYWTLPEPDPRPLPDSELRARYAEVLTDAIRMHLRADVAVGTCLSGGLDSSSIVALNGRLMRQEHPLALERLGVHQQTFSAVYDSEGAWNERIHIDKVAAATGAAANFVVPDAGGLWRDLDDLVWHQDEPFTTTSIFAQWCVMRLARERGVTVLLDGQGADEVLGGYHTSHAYFLRDHLRGGHLTQALRMVSAASKSSGTDLRGTLTKEILRRIPLATRIIQRRREINRRSRAQSLPLMQALQEADGHDVRLLEHRGSHEYLASNVLDDPLPLLLRYEDRNSMAFSIEGRVPFLDHELVELVFRHGGAARMRHGWTKWLQRVTVEDILPRDITWRRDKVGFATPERDWLAGSDALSSAFESSPEVCLYVDVQRARAAMRRGSLERGFAWRTICLAAWLRVFRERAPQWPHQTHAHPASNPRTASPDGNTQGKDVLP